MKTLVARLTPISPAAVAVIALRGPQAWTMLQTHWRPNAGSNVLAVDRIRFGFWVSQSGDTSESIVICATSDLRYEIHCHGGQAAADRILNDLVRQGANVADPMELQFEESPWEESLSDDPQVMLAKAWLLQARTERTASILLDQVRGAWKKAIDSIDEHRRLGRTDLAESELLKLESRRALGQHLVQPWVVAITGSPNVGKSSLLNRWLGYDRAIVHDTPGTTRDLLREVVSFDGWPIELIDTAGIRSTTNAIENAGIEAARNCFESADLILELVAPDLPRESLSLPPTKTILVCTKSDLNRPWPIASEEWESATVVSAMQGTGLAELTEALLKRLIPSSWEPGVAVPLSLPDGTLGSPFA